MVHVSLLTAVVEDQLLEAGELSAGRDVEPAAVQLPDLVMFDVQAFGVVVIQHRQAVGPCGRDTTADDTDRSEPENRGSSEQATAALWGVPAAVKGKTPERPLYISPCRTPVYHQKVRGVTQTTEATCSVINICKRNIVNLVSKG